MSENNKQQSCAERLPARLESNTDRLREALKYWSRDEIEEETCQACEGEVEICPHCLCPAYDCENPESHEPEFSDCTVCEGTGYITPDIGETSEEYEEGILSYDVSIEVDVCLSTGGPADGYKIYLDQDGDITKIKYYFADWFDYAETTLSGEALDLAESMFGETARMIVSEMSR